MKNPLAYVRQKKTGLFVDDKGELTALRAHARLFETAQQAYQSVCAESAKYSEKTFELVIMAGESEVAIDLC